MSPHLAEQDAQLLAFLATGLYSAADIQRRFSWSQPTISRAVSRCKSRIVVVGSARATRYTRLRDVRGLGGRFPVFKVDDRGDVDQIGDLCAVANDRFVWLPTHTAPADYRSLPWFISDLRPDGFVGRAFVQLLHEELNLPPRVLDWNEDHVLVALARRGEDCMGNLIVGQESLERYFRMTQRPIAPVQEGEEAELYARMAQAAMDGDPAGSSAGGEQPKFTAMVQHNDGIKHVLVKFSSSVDTVEGRRWADLLISEHHALNIVQESGIRATQSRIVEGDGRVFLEAQRFDRTGMFGRLPIISLRAVALEFFGCDSWIEAADQMHDDGRISAEDAAALRWLSVFGDLIANTDQHMGNVSLIMMDGRRRFDLAPAYDVLPMFYRPKDTRVPDAVFNPPLPTPRAARAWDSALAAACMFWERVSQDERISEPFRVICAGNLRQVLALRSGPRLRA
ncbi:MAG: transcriptional regulator [Geobacter sp.]|nr:MAG: transcriptional regulator [Geobacter sp.]